jgi:hypothetical protein
MGRVKPNFMMAQIVHNLVSFNGGFRAVVRKTHVLLAYSIVHLIATKRRTVLKLVKLKIRKFVILTFREHPFMHHRFDLSGMSDRSQKKKKKKHVSPACQPLSAQQTLSSFLCFRAYGIGAIYITLANNTYIVLRLNIHQFQARSQNCEKLLLASSSQSVRPHGKTRLPLNEF